jgi:hypothetical protein
MAAKCCHCRAEAGAYGPLGIIFVRLGIAKVDQQPIAEILGDMAVKTPDDLGTGGLVGLDHLAQVFRVHLAGERRGAYQVTGHDGELATFRTRGTRLH